MDYVLGYALLHLEISMELIYRYTASNDVSSRVAQFAQSQWCYSKGFDGACPVGPAVVMKDHAGDLSKMSIKAELNGEVVQESGIK